MAAGSARVSKQTCRDCKWTVYVVVIDGKLVATDPELVAVIPYDGSPRRIFARRIHAELCATRKLEREKREWIKAQKRLKKPKFGLGSGPGL